MSDSPQVNVVDAVDQVVDQLVNQPAANDAVEQPVQEEVNEVVQEAEQPVQEEVKVAEVKVAEVVSSPSRQVAFRQSVSNPQVSNPQVSTQQVSNQSTEPVSHPSPTASKKPIRQPDDLRLNVDQVELIMNCIKTVLDGRKPTTASMLRIIANCLQASRRMKLKPDLAKKLISHSMEAFLREPSNELDEESIQALMTCADLTISEGIDVLDDVSKGKINVKPNSCCIIV